MRIIYRFVIVSFLFLFFSTWQVFAANGDTAFELSGPSQLIAPFPGLPETKGGTYQTTSDNAGNGGTSIPDNDMDVTKGNGDPVEFFIDVTGSLPTFSAVLTIYAYDVDEEQGEVNHVYLNGHFLGKMSGENGKWNTTSFTISDLSWVNSGNNLIEYLIDTGNAGWTSKCDWGQLVIDGGGATMADVTELKIANWSKDASTVTIDIGVSVTASQTSTYKVEANLIDFNDNTLESKVESFSVNASQTQDKTFSFTYNLNDESGLYRVEVNLFDAATMVQQTMQKVEFYHISGTGLNTSPSFSGISDKTITPSGATTINFNINDSEQDPSTITISASSSNQAIIPAANIVLGGSGTDRSITLTPIAEGTSRITLEASDGQTSTTTGFYATVAVINEPPVIQNVNKTISEDNLFTFNSTDFTTVFSDNDNDNLSEIKIISLPSHGTLKIGASAVSVNLVISAGSIGNLNYQPTSNYVGEDSFGWNASDGTDYAQSAASFSFTINAVNDAPIISEIGNQSMDEDTEKELAVTFTDIEGADTHTISVTSSSEKVVVSGLSGNASGSTYKLTPAADWYGTAEITVKVTDNNGAIDQETYTITVNNVNDTPELSVIENQTMDEDANLQLGVEFTDVDPADTHTITITSGNENLKIEEKSGNTSGSTYKLVPVANWNGTTNITVTVKDLANAEDSYTYQITVNAINDAPVLSEIGNQSMDEDTEKELTVTFTDVEGTDTHTLDVTSSSEKVVVSGLSGNVSGSTYKLTPAADWYGTAEITVKVTDNNGAIDQETYTITVNNVNDTPELSVIENQTMDEDAKLQLGVEFTDADPADTHTITITSGNENVKIEEKSGNTSGSTYKVVPVADWYGTANITVTVRDQSNAEDSYSYQVDVNNVNDLPTMSNLGDFEYQEDQFVTAIELKDISPGINENEEVVITVIADNNELIKNCSVAYDGSSSEGELNFKLGEDEFGESIVTIKLDDGQAENNITEVSFNIKVNPVNDPPVYNPLSDRITMEEDAPLQTITITGIEAGPENEKQTLSFMIRSSNSSLYDVLKIDYNNNEPTALLQIKPKANKQGNSQVVVSLFDDQAENSKHQQTINIEIIGVNDSPEISAIPSQTIDEGNSFEIIDLNSYVSDEETLPENIRWSIKGNENLNVSIANGKASITPFNQYWSGEETITFIATDEGGLNVSTQVMFTVNNVNSPPTVDRIADVVVKENEEATVRVTGLSTGLGDVGQTLKISAQVADTEMIENVIVHYTSPNNFAEINIIPVEGRSGETQITVTVEEDGFENSAIMETFGLTIVPVNDPPTMNNISPAVVNWNGGRHSMPINGITAGRSEGNQNLSLHVQAQNSALISSINAEIERGSETGSNLNYVEQNARKSISEVAGDVFYNGTIFYETEKDKSGLSIITVFLNDNENVNNFTTKKTFIIVNSDPTINSVADQVFEENEGIRNIPLSGITGGFVEDLTSISVYTTPLDPGLFEVLSVDYSSPSSTGSLNIKPAKNVSGESQVAITVKGVNSAGEEKYYTKTFNCTVNSVNHIPEFDDIDDVVIDEDSPEYDILLTGISDGDQWEDQKLTIDYSVNNSGLFEVLLLEYSQGSNTAEFSFKPAKDLSGESVISVTLTDDGDGQPSVTKQFKVVVEDKNDAPTLNPINDITISKLNVEKEYKVELTGITSGGVGEDDELEFRLSIPENELLGNVRIEEDEESGKTYLIFTAKPNITDYVLIDVELYDKADITSCVKRSFAVLSGVENIPFFDSISDQIVLEDCGEITLPIIGIRGVGSGNFTFNAIAADENLVEIMGITYSSVTGIAELQFAPKPDMNGSTEITIVMDEDGNAIERKFNLIIHSVNDQPSMTLNESLTMNEDEVATLTVTDLYSGAENENERLELIIWSDKPELFESISNYQEEGKENKIIKIVPNPNMYGSANIYVRVKDNGGSQFGGVDTASTIINVTIQPIDDIPVAIIQESYSVLEDHTTNPILFFINDNDSEISDLNVKAVSLDTSIVKQESIQVGGTGAEKFLVISPNKDVSDTSAVISLELSDGTSTNRSEVLLNIYPVNDPPYFIEQEEIVIEEDSCYEIKLDEYIQDIDNDLNELKIVMMKLGASSSNGIDVSSFADEALWGTTKQSKQLRRITGGMTSIISDSIWVEIDWYKKVARIVTVVNYTTPSTSLMMMVIDPAGDCSIDTLNIKILPVNDAPMLAKLPEFVTKEDSSLSISETEILEYASDVDNDKSELIVNFRSNTNIPIQLDEESGKYIINPVADWFGTDTVFVEVSDTYSSVSGFMLVNVQPVNDVPILKNEIDTVNVCYNTQTSLNLFELFEDIETPDSLLEITSTVNTDSVSAQYNPVDGVLTLDVENELCGYYSLNVKAVDESGAEVSKDITIAAKYSETHWTNALPEEYTLFQNYPNPFNPLTKIRYGVPIDSKVTLTIYNILGEKLFQTPEEVKSAGYYEFNWNASRYSSGIYLYVISAESADGSQKYVKAKKMVMMK